MQIMQSDGRRRKSRDWTWESFPLEQSWRSCPCYYWLHKKRGAKRLGWSLELMYFYHIQSTLTLSLIFFTLFGLVGCYFWPFNFLSLFNLVHVDKYIFFKTVCNKYVWAEFNLNSKIFFPSVMINTAMIEVLCFDSLLRGKKYKHTRLQRNA